MCKKGPTVFDEPTFLGTRRTRDETAATTAFVSMYDSITNTRALDTQLAASTKAAVYIKQNHNMQHVYAFFIVIQYCTMYRQNSLAQPI